MRILLLLLLLIVRIEVRAEDPAAYELPEIDFQGQAPEAHYLDSLPSVTHLQGNALERRKQSTIG
jgi:hypothetical protein